MKKNAASLCILVPLILGTLLSAGCKRTLPASPPITDTSTTDTTTRVPADRGDLTAKVEQHIVFTGIIGLVPQADGTVRFLVPRHGGMAHVPDHHVWIIIPQENATSTYVGKPETGIGANRKPLLAFPAGDGVIELAGLPAGAVTRDDLGGIANSADFFRDHPQPSPVYSEKLPPQAQVDVYGDLSGGSIAASNISTSPLWRYAEGEDETGSCMALAQEVCHLSQVSEPLTIRVRGKQNYEITVPAAAGKIEVRIANTPEAFPAPRKAPSPDTHFALYHAIAQEQSQKKLLPYACSDSETLRPEDVPGRHLHEHGIDVPMPRSAASVKTATDGDTPIRMSSVGSINCPPTWWCTNPPNCD